MKLLPARAAGVLADTINDADSTRKVYLLAAGLAVLGFALIAITVWFWRSTRNDPEVLAPLEVLGDRKFRRLEGSEQRKRLEESRPTDAKPLQWGVRRGAAADGPALTASAADDSLIVSDGELAETAGAGDSLAAAGGPVGVGSDDAADPIDDLDSILAAAGAVVPGRAALARAASIGPDPDEPADAAASGADPIAVLGLSSTSAGGPTSDAPSSAVTSEPAGPPAAAAEPAAVPLLIVPVDHDLRPSVGRTVEPLKPLEPLRPREPAARARRVEIAPERVESDHRNEELADFDDRDGSIGRGAFDAARSDDSDVVEGIEDDIDDVDDDVDATASIDPLLRMFHRNDT